MLGRDAVARERDVHRLRVKRPAPGLAAGHPGQRLLQAQRLVGEDGRREGVPAVAEAQRRAARRESRRGDVRRKRVAAVRGRNAGTSCGSTRNAGGLGLGLPRRSGSRLGRGYRLPRGVSRGDDDGEQRQHRRQLCASGVHVLVDGTLARGGECRGRANATSPARTGDCPASTAPRSPSEGQTFSRVRLESFPKPRGASRHAPAGHPGAPVARGGGGGNVVGGPARGDARAGRGRAPAGYFRGFGSGRRWRGVFLERDGRDGVPGVRRDVVDAGEDRVVQGLHPVRGSARGREVRRGAGVLLRRGSVQDGDGPLDGVAENSIGELSAPAEKTFDRRRSRCV